MHAAIHAAACMFMRGVVSDGPDTTLDLDGVASWPLWRGSRSTTTCRWRERRGCRSCRCRKDCRSLVAWGSILSMLCAIELSFSPRNPDFQGKDTLERKNLLDSRRFSVVRFVRKGSLRGGGGLLQLFCVLSRNLSPSRDGIAFFALVV